MVDDEKSRDKTRLITRLFVYVETVCTSFRFELKCKVATVASDCNRILSSISTRLQHKPHQWLECLTQNSQRDLFLCFSPYIFMLKMNMKYNKFSQLWYARPFSTAVFRLPIWSRTSRFNASVCQPRLIRKVLINCLLHFADCNNWH